MGVRFRRTKKILLGMRLNLGKRGVSVSLGPKGLKHTISTTGKTTTTVGIPGSGLSYSKVNSREKLKNGDGLRPIGNQDAQTQPTTPVLSRKLRAAIIFCSIAIGLLIFAVLVSIFL
jgi:hypothetical protein